MAKAKKKKPAGKRLVLHVTPLKPSGWAIKQVGNAKPLSTHKTKAVAVKKATAQARKHGHAQVRIHKQDGKIQEERTYGADPYPPRG